MMTARQCKRKLIRSIEWLIKAAQKFGEDDMRYYAAALTYQVFFSLFPFLIFFVALLGALDLLGYFDRLLDQAQVVLPEQAPGIVVQALEQIRSHSQTFLSLSIIVALWPASSAVRMTMHALNVAYDVQEE